MDKTIYYELPEFSAILSFIDAIFRELNMGLFIYYMEHLDVPSSLKLIYANKEASRATGADLRQHIGKRIFEAFPNLAQSQIPKLFAEVANRKESRRVDEFEYADEKLKRRSYRVKAFPMPSDCVGVLFERI
jgi:hypothetical protein